MAQPHTLNHSTHILKNLKQTQLVEQWVGGGGGGAAPTNLKLFYRWMRFVTEPPSDKRPAGVNKLHAGNGWSRAHVFPSGGRRGKRSEECSTAPGGMRHVR